jgi:hypothetical protein
MSDHPVYYGSLTRRDPSWPKPIGAGWSVAPDYATLHVVVDGRTVCGAPRRAFDPTPDQARALLTKPPRMSCGEPLPEPARCPICFASL